MKTRHVLSRASQRGVRPADLDLILRYGTETPNGVILTRSDFAEIDRQHKKLIGRLSHLVDKFVVMRGGYMATVFQASKPQRRRETGRG